ncbi:TVP38/TMEM64 family protein [Cytobacillus purgationiresistens]|uniref:TVP38/TMEM64 family membrane protein n=1 Tax=Cytobacillus purgationiresistens TaxID=863449 RepID=A0ABU0AT85_9BACI|nr:VTT domain-containing protein [Cytobacillus purgationiresistens]MDQ0273982.1 putative membrane protein YdjX (TVP38/TMEM64 family) [Cytobacillus purgationiresistens]
MKRKLAFISSWILVIYCLVYFDVLPIDIDTIMHFITDKEEYASLLFIAAWIVRLLFLMPGTPLTILGGVSFGPLQGSILSTIGLVLSGSLIYFISRSIVGKKVNTYMLKKHIDLNHLLKVHNYKILALGMVCPLVPSDVLCFLSAVTGIKYSTYILTIVIANTPLRILYGYIGINFTKSALGLSLSLISILLIFIVSIKIWKTLKTQLNTQQ